MGQAVVRGARGAISALCPAAVDSAECCAGRRYRGHFSKLNVMRLAHLIKKRVLYLDNGARLCEALPWGWGRYFGRGYP